MFELFREINWSLLGTLAVVSALVAWAGDIIGMKLGKKRVTFLKLRPKYTSRIISVITGIGIALFTLLVISVASEPVRTALFSMNYVQNQITNLTAELQQNRANLQNMEVELFKSKGDVIEKQEELNSLEQRLAAGTKSLREARAELERMTAIIASTEEEQKALLKEKASLEQETKRLESSVASLKDEAERLKADIQRLREGRIAALTGERLAQGVISGSELTSQQIDLAVDRLTEEARALLAYRFGTKPEAIKMPIVDQKFDRPCKIRAFKDTGTLAPETYRPLQRSRGRACHGRTGDIQHKTHLCFGRSACGKDCKQGIIEGRGRRDAFPCAQGH